MLNLDVKVNAQEVEAMNGKELKKLASEIDLEGRSKLTKVADLREALLNALFTATEIEAPEASKIKITGDSSYTSVDDMTLLPLFTSSVTGKSNEVVPNHFGNSVFDCNTVKVLILDKNDGEVSSRLFNRLIREGGHKVISMKNLSFLDPIERMNIGTIINIEDIKHELRMMHLPVSWMLRSSYENIPVVDGLLPKANYRDYDDSELEAINSGKYDTFNDMMFVQIVDLEK